MEAAAHVRAIPPPAPPGDLIQSALFIPLSEITLTKHTGRKLRTIGQVLAFDPSTSLVLLAAAPQTPPTPTLLANLTTPLLAQPPGPSSSALVQHTVGTQWRENLTLARGEWVCIVGWLEGDATNVVAKVDAGDTYLPPLGVILEAIHISASRPPPIGAVYTGSLVS